VTVAQLEPYKGVDTGLRAVAQLRREGLEVGYLVIGSGKQREAYRRLAAELDVADAVRFTGNVPDADLAALYNCGIAYLGLSRRSGRTSVEGFGLALAEAGACGLPVIAARSGGLAEAVQEGESGFVVEPDEPAAAAAALKRVLSDQLLARRLGQGARKSVETLYNWDRVIRDLREIEDQIA